VIEILKLLTEKNKKNTQAKVISQATTYLQQESSLWIIQKNDGEKRTEEEIPSRKPHKSRGLLLFYVILFHKSQILKKKSSSKLQNFAKFAKLFLFFSSY
jgi:hypothetical protein